MSCAASACSSVGPAAASRIVAAPQPLMPCPGPQGESSAAKSAGREHKLCAASSGVVDQPLQHGGLIAAGIRLQGVQRGAGGSRDAGAIDGALGGLGCRSCRVRDGDRQQPRADAGTEAGREQGTAVEGHGGRLSDRVQLTVPKQEPGRSALPCASGADQHPRRFAPISPRTGGRRGRPPEYRARRGRRLEATAPIQARRDRREYE